MAETHRFSVRKVESDEEVDGIESELENARGVETAEIDTDSGAAEVRYDADEIGEEQIRGAVQDMGYEVS